MIQAPSAHADQSQGTAPPPREDDHGDTATATAELDETAQPPADWRRVLLAITVSLFWAILAARLVQLQYVSRDQYHAQANRQRQFREPIRPRPGEILDRRGRLLATTVVAQSLYVVPNRIKYPDAVAEKLAAALEQPQEELLKKLHRYREKEFLWIDRRLSDDAVARVRELELPPEVWGFREEYLRRYPQGELAAHVLGLRDIDGVGHGGVEQGFEHILRGRDGERVLVRDARGRVIDVLTDHAAAPVHGQTLVLTIDAVIQMHAERALELLMEEWQPENACAIVLDPASGEVLAMASRPTFSPGRLTNVPDAAWKNTAIAAMYEPGSTFKPFVVAWAMEQGMLKRDEQFDCEGGAYRMGRRILHDHHPYGMLSLSDVLVKSSNIGMAKIGERLTNTGLYECTIAFGFGRSTSCGLPGELGGLVRAPGKWDHYSVGSIPMGQELAVTPLQMIVAHAALANGGKLIAPRLVTPHPDREQSVSTDLRTPTAAPSVVSNLLTPDTAHWVRTDPMAGVVARGTGRQGQLKQYRVFGKTGTAQKIDPDTGAYSDDQYVLSFICGAPLENPRALVLVCVDSPTKGTSHYGGTVAAPTAATILEKTLIYLRVPGDQTGEATVEH